MVLVGLLAFYAQRRDLYGLYQTQRDSEQRVEVLQKELAELEQEKDSLQGHVQRLDTDPGELEAASRRTRNLVREGETVYVIPLPQDTPKNKKG